jgi:hypothetical protein
MYDLEHSDQTLRKSLVDADEGLLIHLAGHGWMEGSGERELAYRISVLQAARLALPPVVSPTTLSRPPGKVVIDQDASKRNALVAQYARLDKRIAKLVALRDTYRTTLLEEDREEALAEERRPKQPESSKDTPAASRDTVADSGAGRAASPPPSAGMQLVSNESPQTEAHEDAPALPPKPAAKPTPPLWSRVWAPISELLVSFFVYIIDSPKQTLVNFLLACFYFLLVLLGIMAGSVFDVLGTQYTSTNRLSAREVAALAFSRTGWQGLLASPIVFALVKVSLPATDFNFGLLLFAFQNGFFWRITLKRLSESPDSDKKQVNSAPA